MVGMIRGPIYPLFTRVMDTASCCFSILVWHNYSTSASLHHCRLFQTTKMMSTPIEISFGLICKQLPLSYLFISVLEMDGKYQFGALIYWIYKIIFINYLLLYKTRQDMTLLFSNPHWWHYNDICSAIHFSF